MNANLRNFALWVVIGLLLLGLFTLFQNPAQRTAPGQTISFSQLLNEVDQGRVRDVVLQGPEVRGTYTDGRRFHTYIVPNDPTLTSRLYGKGVSVSIEPPDEALPWFVSLLASWLPFIGLIGVWIWLSRRTQQGGGMTVNNPPSISRNEFEGIKRQLADIQKDIDALKGRFK